MRRLADGWATVTGRLGPRERLALGVGLTALAGIVLLFGIWRPLTQQVDRLRDQVAQQEALRAWMAGAAAEVRQLRATAPPAPTARSDQSLLSLADRTAREAGLAGAIRRVEPEGSDRVRIIIERANFDLLTDWLEHAARDFGLDVARITVERQDEPGLVNARLVLQATTPS